MFPERQGSLGNWPRAAFCFALAVSLCAQLGCTRRFFRKQADKEVEHILREKDKYDFWKIDNYHIYPDSRARFADTSNPDRPPMPPDDPAARDLAPNPQRPGKGGVKWEEGTGYIDMLENWNALNRARLAEEALPPPRPKEKIEQTSFRPSDPEVHKLPTLVFQGTQDYPKTAEAPKEDGYLLNLEQAVELGVINSREFQTQREVLYLTALPVTLQRFSFAAQFFLTEDIIREWNRSETANPGNRFNFNSAAGFAKLFSTGALLTLQFANRTIIDLTGNAARRTVSVSDINLDLVQPLLRGGGRAVSLEPLTQVERNLVYAIRDYARFRKTFYVNVAADQAAGYLPTLARQVQVEVNQKNVDALTRFLPYFQGYQEMGTVEPIQVDQVKLDKLRAEVTVLNSNRIHKDNLDRFKVQLGLPVNVPLKLDDEPIRPMAMQLKNYEKIQVDFDAFVKELDKDEYFLMSNAKQLRTRLKAHVAKAPLITETVKFREEFPKRWAEREKLSLKELAAHFKADEAEYNRLKLKKLDFVRKDKDLPPAEEEKLEQLAASLQLTLFDRQLREYMEEPWIKQAQAKFKDKEQIENEKKRLHAAYYEDLINSFVQVIGEAVNERFRLVAASWPAMAAIEVEGMDLLKIEEELAHTLASHTAHTNRLDLMNQRALVVDAWRQLTVSANFLLGAVNVGYHLDTTTPAGQAKPLAFAPQRTRQNVFLNIDLPLVRLAERNAYRAALIAYQQERRALMGLEDQIAASIRRTLRQLRVIAETYRIRQKEVETAYKQVESSLEKFRQPPEEGGRGAGNAAALTDQLLRAQRGLVSVQNQLYDLWIDFQTNRLQLYLDLELMPLDGRGVWIDELSNREPGVAADGNDATSRRNPAEQYDVGQRPGSERVGNGVANLSSAALQPRLPKN